MKRELQKLEDCVYDFLIVGGGIYGAVVCWMATLAGFNVALIEQGDFAQATSSNSQKIIHGGLRYLQHLDLPRLVQSLKSRNLLMWLAPHLVHQIKCTMPIYGHGIKGREAMAIGMAMYNLITNGINASTKNRVNIPKAQLIDSEEMLAMFPEIERGRLNSAAVWFEGISQNTERLVLLFIKSAFGKGAVISNYIKAIRYRGYNDGTLVVSARDALSGQMMDIKTEKVINCTGPWHEDTLRRIECSENSLQQEFAAGLNLITKPVFKSSSAIGLINPAREKSRLFFVVPWRNRSIIGTEWFYCNDQPLEFQCKEEYCQKFIEKFNAACPAEKLTMDDVLHVHWGLVPCRPPCGNNGEIPSISKKFRILDLSPNGSRRIVNVLGVKYTTADDVARKVLKYVEPELKPDFGSIPQLSGGEIENFSCFKDSMTRKWKEKLPITEIDRLVINYGSEMESLLTLLTKETTQKSPKAISHIDVTKAETLFAVRHEMAQKLSDVVLRRTDIGTAGLPSDEELRTITAHLSKELGWLPKKASAEIDELKKAYPPFLRENSNIDRITLN